MTAFGKILAFLNLIFAVLTGGLIGMVYLTRTNWQQAYTAVQNKAQAANVAYQQLLADEMSQVRAKDQQAQAALAQVNEKDKQLAAARAEVEQAKGQLEAAKRSNDKASENVTNTTTEIERRRAEVKQLQETLMARETRVRDLEAQLTKVRDEAVNNKLQYDSLKEKFATMMAQYEDSTKQLAAFAAAGLSVPRAGTKAVPPEQVRGTIKAVDGNLATISIGTDAGVNKDNILYIYRLSPQAEYIGRLTILSATSFEAVGRIETARRQATVKPGDEVASQITTKK
ncbi:MAG: hypothetical protein K1X57_06050 [Gemmataceae bacterium]|nr:hypothetical protein [Gemmataceae bacterium]